MAAAAADATMLSSSSTASFEARLSPLRGELDPEGLHGDVRVFAALKSVGLEPEDVHEDVVTQGLDIHDKVPKEKAPSIKQQRRDVWDGLRSSRLDQTREALATLSDSDARRFARCESGVRPIDWEEDVPPLDMIAGVGDIQDIQRRALEKVAADQARKAKAICTDFLMNKKRAEDSDAKIGAVEARLATYKKAQEDKLKLKRATAAKDAEKRRAQINRAKNDQEEREAKIAEELAEKTQGAAQRRAERYSTANMAAKQAANDQKRIAVFNQAVEQEERMLEKLEIRRAEVDERLEYRRQVMDDFMAAKREESNTQYQQKQVDIHIAKQQWAEKKYDAHQTFTNSFHDRRNRRKEMLAERSKSTGALNRKERDKWQSNYNRVLEQRGNFADDLMARCDAATDRVENELKPMKLKCGMDVFSHQEVKDKTFLALTTKRQQENKRCRDAQIQALLFKVAEQDAKFAAKKEGEEMIRNKRQEANKESLKYADNARAVFIRIQSEPNESKIRSAMQSLGFKMPKLGKVGDGDDDS